MPDWTFCFHSLHIIAKIGTVIHRIMSICSGLTRPLACMIRRQRWRALRLIMLAPLPICTWVVCHPSFLWSLSRRSLSLNPRLRFSFRLMSGFTVLTKRFGPRRPARYHAKESNSKSRYDLLLVTSVICLSKASWTSRRVLCADP